MTRVIVNDASCLIDLQKGRLLHVLPSLPFEFVIPLPVKESELLTFTPQEWQMLLDADVKVYDLPAEQVAEALDVKTSYPGLSANDCFCLITTRHHENAVLLTGDGLLRRAAEERQMEVHGVLWIIDLLDEHTETPKKLLLQALEIWKEDRNVFLPDPEIENRLKKLRSR